jgi:TonB family protein
MVVALCLLLLALGVVIIRDRDFWFPSSPETQADAIEPETDPTARPQTTSAATVPAVGKAKKKPVAQAKEEPPVAAPVVTAERRALPPLQIEVVAGDERRTVRPGNTALKVDLQPRVPPRPAEEATVESKVANGPAVNVSERVRLSPETSQAVSHPVNPDYPLLARQMKVQGSVILQALIGRDGSIQDLRVVSGPAILAAAAREAVKQWRFKPYFQEGQPIETQARITVNFTISTT